MAVFRRNSRTTERSGSWIVFGLAAVLFLDGRGSLAGGLTQGAEPAQLATSDQPEEPSDDEPAGPSNEEPLPAMISGPRNLLARRGVDQSHFARLIDGRPVGDNENETLLKIMFSVRRDFRLVEVQRWAHDELNLAELAKDPEANRGRIFLLSGRVTLVERRRPLPEVAERFELKQYYRCEFMLGQRQPAVIFTQKIPIQWQEGGPIEGRASAFGLFLKFAGKRADRLIPVFVAPRIAWHPRNLLGDLGMDVGLFEEVENQKAITGRERECFYQMLAAVGRAQPNRLIREANKQLKQLDEKFKRTDKQGNEHFSVVPLFMQPDKQHERLVVLEGTARRVVKIRLGKKDQDIVERFGIDHYYNLFIFTDDSEGNPLVFCVRELPEGMPTGDDAQYGERLRVAGFFFKLWRYRIAMPSRAREPRRARGVPRQPAPLLIGREPVWYPREKPPTNPTAAAVASGLFVLAILGIWLAVWRYGHGDRQFHQRTLAKAHSIDSGSSLSEIGLDVDGTPDFSGVDEMDRGKDARENE